jgi:hypothetical protein
MAPTRTASLKRSSKGLVLGRSAAAKMNAVEGVSLSKETREIFRRFDELGLSADERRRLLKKKFRAHLA